MRIFKCCLFTTHDPQLYNTVKKACNKIEEIFQNSLNIKNADFNDQKTRSSIFNKKFFYRFVAFITIFQTLFLVYYRSAGLKRLRTTALNNHLPSNFHLFI